MMKSLGRVSKKTKKNRKSLIISSKYWTKQNLNQNSLRFRCMLSMVTRSSARRIANNNCQRLGQNNLLTKRISLFNFFGVAGCPPPRATELELLLPASSISSACCNPNDTGAIIKLLMEMVALSLVVDGPDTPNTCSKCFSDFYRANRKHMV